MTYISTPTATSTTSSLSLHDALPISEADDGALAGPGGQQHSLMRRERGSPNSEHDDRDRRHLPVPVDPRMRAPRKHDAERSEEHTSELQSQFHLVCRLLLEKKKLTLEFVLTVDCFLKRTSSILLSKTLNKAS